MFDATGLGTVNPLKADCPIVDISRMLQDQDAASADLEDNLDIAGNGFPTFSFHDDNQDGMYQDEEDIFLDGNANGIVD